MSVSVQISDELAAKAETISELFNRSLAGQIEYWAGIGQLAEENSDLPLSFISDILINTSDSFHAAIAPRFKVC